VTDGQTDGQTEFSSQYRVCITCCAVKTKTNTVCCRAKTKLTRYVTVIDKMIKKISATSWSFFFRRAKDNTTRGNNWKLKKKHILSYRYSKWLLQSMVKALI